MKRIRQFGALFSFLFLAQLAFSQAGSTFTNPMVIGSLPYSILGDSTCGYGDNYTTANIACTGSYMTGDEKIYSFTPGASFANVTIEMTNIATSWSGIYVTDDSTTAGSCLGSATGASTADRIISGLSLTSGTTYYIIISTWASPQCITSFDLSVYNVTCPAPTGLSVTNISHDSVVLNWTENGLGTNWQIEWDTNGFVLGTGNVINTTLNPDTLSGLSQLTNYSFYVRTICGAGDSSLWVGPYNFTTLPTCPAPTALGVSNITDVSCNLFWTENGSATQWQIEWDTNGFTPGTGTISLTSSNPNSLSGLTASTDYQFYVRTVCGAGDSSVWIGPFGFTTACSVISAPYSESFDATSIPNCWNQYATTGGPWVFGNPGISWNTSGCSAPSEHTGNSGNMASMDHSSTDVGVILELPVVDVTSLTTPNLSFWYYMCATGYTPTNKLFIEAWNGTSWTLVDSNVTGTVGWEKQSFDLSTHTYGSNLVWVRLRTESGGSSSDFYGDAGIDDVLIDEAPNCLAPTSLSASNVLANSADLSWTEAGSAILWEYEYVFAGSGQGTGVIGTTALNPISITGLSSQSDYEFFVRAICGAGDSSTWTGPSPFTTPCASIIPPYLEPFNSFLPSICWEQAGSGTPATGPSAIGSSSWGQSGFPGTGTGGTRINLYTTGKEEWILTPIFDLSTGGPYELKIEALLAAYSGGGPISMGSDDTVQVLISNDGGSTWAAIYTWDTLNAPSNAGGFEYIDLTLYSSATTQFAIWATEGTVNDPEDYWFYIGSFEIRNIPTCYEPTTLAASNVTSSSAEISWVEFASATLWEYQYDTSGFTLGTGTSDTTSSMPYTINGLLDQTDYQVYVRAVCGSGDSSLWVGPISFTTLCNAIVAPLTEDVEGFPQSLNSVIENCWGSSPSATTSAFRWNVSGTGTTTSGSTGPDAANSGTNFFFTEASSGSTGAVAELYTPLIDLSGVNNPKLTFAYHMYGAAMGNLYIDVFNGSSWINDVDSIVGQQQTSGADSWLNKNVDLSTYSGSIQVRFRGVRGTSFTSDMAIDDITFDSTATLVVSTAVDSNVTCYGYSNGGGNVTVSGGATPYEYLWSTGDVVDTINNVMAGVHYITVTDAFGTTLIDSITITEPSQIMVNLGNDTTVCLGSAFTLDAGMFTAYLWDDASVAQTRALSNNVVGSTNYWLEVTDGSGCMESDTINVSVQALPVVNLGNDTLVCLGTTVTLDAGAFNSYLWDDATTMQTRDVVGTTAGSSDYWVEITDALGCVASDTTNIEVVNPVMPDLGNDTVICFGSTLTLDAGVFNSYLWDDATTMQTRDVVGTTSGAMDYHVTTDDANGCMGSDTVMVTVDTPIMVDLGSDLTLCNGESVTLDAGTFSSYLWDDGSTTQTRIITATTVGAVDYSVMVTTAVGCDGGDTVTITGLPPVVVDLGPDTSIIWFGSDTTYLLDAGAGFATYLWTDGSTNQTNVANLSNQGTIVVIVTDSKGCTGSDTILVDFILSVPTFDVSSLKMYPNPAEDRVNIELTNFNNVRDVNITFLTITGEVVMTQHIQVTGNTYTKSFDVSNLATGTYLVQFEANGEVVVKRFVIK